jgi:CBS domain-containing protein
MLVRDVMSEVLVQTTLDEGVVSVGKRLLEKRASCAIVEDSCGKLVGMISKEGFVLSVKYIGGNPLEGFKVRDFMEEDVSTVTPDDPLSEAVDRLLNVPYRIDRLPVVGKDMKVVGILSKAHIVSLFADKVKKRFKVRDLMRFDPTTVYDYTPVRDVLEKIDCSSDKHVLVLAGERLVGILTILDLAVAFFEERVRKGKIFDWNIYADMKAEDIMTRNPATIEGKKDAADAAQVMVDKHIGGIPVINRKLEGLISRTEIVKGYKIFCEQG